ncbi:transcription factor Adf-1-like [Drosophila albomicans]|uniref:Transcription factor Adf-1-like n=1 Tax=Drosophila albomicans TaxID=7291 RepID=A0A6P8XXE4_DROAB|nr:transcription factor Adf-1-like [Drosophila albomicans]
MDIENLISEVFLRPALWDQKSKNYHNRILVEKNWTEIENMLETSKDGLKKKWKNLRDQFRNEWKKIPISKSGDSGVSEEAYSNYTSWPHFNSLLFLKDQIKPCKSVGNFEASQLSFEPSSSEFASQLSQDEIISEEIHELCEDETPKKKSKRSLMRQRN